MQTILITGGTGLIGKAITALALEKGYHVRILTRSPKPAKNGISYAFWNPAKQEIAPDALIGIDYVIHLAGENIGENKWTPNQKEEIYNSRKLATELLHSALENQENKVKKIIVASAIGFYGNNEGVKPFVETDKGTDTGFAAEVAIAWEGYLDKLLETGKPVIKCRVGIVLSNDGGAFPQMLTPAKMGVGYLGNGKQVLSWIHIDDIARAFMYFVENAQQSEIFNLVAPNPVSYTLFCSILSKVLKMPILVPFVPAFVIKLVLGEMSALVLKGSTVSSKHLEASGFKFSYPELDGALKNLLKK